MKVFLSFRYTGETEEGLREFFTPVVEKLRAQGSNVYFSLDDLVTWGSRPMREKFLSTFKSLSESDLLFVVVRSEEKSEGMLMEVGYALAKNIPITLALQKGVKTYITEIANKVVEFNSREDLQNNITNLWIR